MFTKKDQMDLFQAEPVTAKPGKRKYVEIDYELSGVQWNITTYKCEKAPICYFETLAYSIPLMHYGVTTDNKKSLYLIKNITKEQQHKYI